MRFPLSPVHVLLPRQSHGSIDRFRGGVQPDSRRGSGTTGEAAGAIDDETFERVDEASSGLRSL